MTNRPPDDVRSSERACSYSGCSTRLSRYNKSGSCFVHETPAFNAQTAMGRTSVVEILRSVEAPEKKRGRPRNVKVWVDDNDRAHGRVRSASGAPIQGPSAVDGEDILKKLADTVRGMPSYLEAATTALAEEHPGQSVLSCQRCKSPYVLIPTRDGIPLWCDPCQTGTSGSA